MKYLTGLILLALVVFSTQGAFAADTSKIGILDLQKCLQESNEGKRISETLKTKQEGMQKELTQKDQELRDMANDIEKQSLMLSPEAKDAKQKEYDKKRRDLAYLAQDMEDDMKRAQANALNDIYKIISGIVTDIAKKEKFDMIAVREPRVFLFVSEKLDITDKVIAELNKQKP